MSTVIDYTALRENYQLHYVLCHIVGLIWESIGILEDDDFDEKIFSENPYAQKINMKKQYLWKWLCNNYPDQEIVIFDNNKNKTTFNTSNHTSVLGGISFDTMNVNKPLEAWIF
jgi:hypothetical protein